MKLKHVTSLSNAVAIIESQTFLPHVTASDKGDSGLNCFVEGMHYIESHYEAEGAVLVFRWDGPETSDTDKMLEPNWLCHWGGWRSVVTGGTEKYLTAVDLKALQGEVWEELVGTPPWYAFRKRRWISQCARELKWGIYDRLQLGVPISVR